MKKITKKEIKEFIRDVKETKKNMGWSIYQTGAYILNNRVKLFVGFNGQGLDLNVYNRTYDKIIDFDIYEYSVDYIYDEINSMIEEYNKELDSEGE